MAETITQLEHKRALMRITTKSPGLLTLEVNFGWEEQSLPNGDCVWQVHCEE